MRWITRYREIIVPALVVIGVSLLLANLIKHHLLSSSALTNNKDALAALNNSVNIVVIVVGSVFSYYRFFRGRTFYSRAELKITVEVIRATADVFIHFVTLEAKNIGTLSIWNPVPVLKMYQYGPDGSTETTFEHWSEAKSPKAHGESLAVIDSGESASFWADTEVAAKTWAVVYTAFVHADSGDIWKQVAVVKNIETKKSA